MSAVHPAQTSPFDHTSRPIEPVTSGATRRALHTRFLVEDGNDVALGHALRPTWRGGVHVIGLIIAVPAVLALLLSSASGTRLRVGVGVYAVGLCSMLGTSATYHRWVHGLRARCAWRRLDHAAIFAAIAGSSTPIVLAALPGAPGFVLVGSVWSAALIGAVFKLSRWGGGDRAGTVMYAVTIALGAVAVPWLWVREGIAPSVFVIAGGAAYLFGAACFATRWPKLRPTVFSYHEVWHVFTLIAATTQFTAIWMLAT
jgi:hemolysin III